MKTLILYYSWSQTTAQLATLIAQTSTADVVELTVDAATFSTDMYATAAIAKQQLMAKRLPTLTNALPNFNDYQLLLIGGPVWSGTVATPVQSLLSQLAGFKGQIKPFLTDVGNAGQYVAEFERLTPAQVVLPALELTADDIRQTSSATAQIQAWLN
ncbi:flavodoxin family protein [Lactiplantibacillus daowaiensis]|uniref:Flavodoxin family protein n=1 Tax=Lactiplantibacillus daowaiensis TaxID=2559918 RepID=A0ABW1S312_9LACO